MRQTLFSRTALGFALLLGASAISAQQGAASHPVAGDPKDLVVLALVGDKDLGDAKGLITRYKGGYPRNVVQIRRSTASAGVLEVAMQQLSGLRRITGHVPNKSTRTYVMTKRVDSADPATQDLFARLMRATPQQVWEIGMVPSITVQIVDGTDEKSRKKP